MKKVLKNAMGKIFANITPHSGVLSLVDTSKHVMYTNFIWCPRAGDFTIMAWFNCQKSGNNVLIATGDTGTSTSLLWFGINTTVRLTLGSVTVGGSTNLINTGWKHIAVTRESGIVKFYVNGVRDGSQYTLNNNIDTSSNKPTITIGSIGNFGSSYSKGQVSTVRIFNRALNQADISFYKDSTEKSSDPSLAEEFLMIGTGLTEVGTRGSVGTLTNGMTRLAHRVQAVIKALTINTI